MPIQMPMLLSTTGTPRFAARADDGSIVADVTHEDREFSLPTFQGAAIRLPDGASLRTVCRVKLMAVAEKPLSAEVRDGAAANLNNLAALCILIGEWLEAWRAIEDAEEQFVIIANDLLPGATPALLGLAVVRYNAATLGLLEGDTRFCIDMKESGLKTLEQVPTHERGPEFGFLSSGFALLDTGR